jgi:hypothetical protein
MSNPHTSGNTGGSERASGKHRGLRQPADDQRDEDKVDNIGLKDSSATLEDHLRDRRSKGVRGGFDDSIEHDADDGPVSDQDVARSPRAT